MGLNIIKKIRKIFWVFKLWSKYDEESKEIKELRKIWIIFIETFENKYICRILFTSSKLLHEVGVLKRVN